MFLISMLVLILEPATFQARYKLDPVPMDSEFYIQEPCSFARDDQGRHYLLDCSAKTLFIWDEHGKFLQTLGRPGQGPGEFEFPASRSSVNVYKNRIFVVDSRRRVIHVFEDFKFLKTLSTTFGSPQKVVMTSDGNFVVEFYNYSRKGSKTEIWLLNPEFEKKVKLAEMQDDHWVKNDKGGWTYRFFAGEYMLFAHPDLDRIYMGHILHPEIQVFSNEGQLVETIQLRIARDPMIEGLKESLAPSLLQDSRNQVIYPEYLPYQYTFYVSGSQIVAFNYGGPNLEIKASVLDKGNVVGVYSDHLGEGGAIFPSYPEVLRMSVNDVGDYEIAMGQIKVGVEPGL